MVCVCVCDLCPFLLYLVLSITNTSVVPLSYLVAIGDVQSSVAMVVNDAHDVDCFHLYSHCTFITCSHIYHACFYGTIVPSIVLQIDLPFELVSTISVYQ